MEEEGPPGLETWGRGETDTLEAWWWWFGPTPAADAAEAWRRKGLPQRGPKGSENLTLLELVRRGSAPPDTWVKGRLHLCTYFHWDLQEWGFITTGSWETWKTCRC